MTFLEGQIESKKAMITYWQVRILSGEYKTRHLAHGFSGPKFTEEENLKDAVNTLHTHVHQLRDLTDALYPSNPNNV